jgi:hypothetical protein
MVDKIARALALFQLRNSPINNCLSKSRGREKLVASTRGRLVSLQKLTHSPYCCICTLGDGHLARVWSPCFRLI